MLLLMCVSSTGQNQGSPCKNSLSKAEHLCIEWNHIFNAMKKPFHARDASNIICESVMYIPVTDIYAMYLLHLTTLRFAYR